MLAAYGAVMDLDEKKHWDIDRRIPIATIGAFLGFVILQSAAFGMWMARTDARVAALEEWKMAAIVYGEKIAVTQEKVGNLERMFMLLEQHLRSDRKP